MLGSPTISGSAAGVNREGAGDARPEGTLRRALRSQRRPVTLAAALVTVHQVAEVLVPVTVGVVIDRAIAPGDAAAAVRWLGVLALQFVVLSAAGCTAVYVDEKARLGANHTVRTAVAARVLDERGGVERALPGEIVSLSTVETARIGDGVGAVIMGVGAVAGVVGGAVVLFAVSFRLGAAVLVGLPIVLLVVQALAEPLVARADSHQEAVGTASGVAADLFRGLRVLKGLGADRAAAARYRVVSRMALGAGLDANRARSTYAGFTVTIASAFVALVAWLGARLALDGAISLGSLIAALGVTQFLVGPLGRLALAGSELAQARASSDHLDAALHAEPAVVGGDAVPDGNGPLILDGITHGPLRDVSLRVPAGRMVAVVADPADAAALIDCLDRSVAIQSGRVLLGEVDHADLTLSTARATVMVAHHDAPLFGPTITADLHSVPGRTPAAATTAGTGAAAPEPTARSVPTPTGGTGTATDTDTDTAGGEAGTRPGTGPGRDARATEGTATPGPSAAAGTVGDVGANDEAVDRPAGVSANNTTTTPVGTAATNDDAVDKLADVRAKHTTAATVGDAGTKDDGIDEPAGAAAAGTVGTTAQGPAGVSTRDATAAAVEGVGTNDDGVYGPAGTGTVEGVGTNDDGIDRPAGTAAAGTVGTNDATAQGPAGVSASDATAAAVGGVGADDYGVDGASGVGVAGAAGAPLVDDARAGQAGVGGVAVEDAVAAACLDDVAAVVPGGLDGPITEAGRSLSGGQRQRVALARVLAADAPVLVLHEPTTAVDTATEQRIAAGLRRLRRGRTTLLITSSPTLLATADRVVLLHEGRVVAEGPHATLASDPRYRTAVLG